MTKPDAIAEPSMDEILTSIRKIIAEDEVDETDIDGQTDEDAVTSQADEVESDGDDDILELSEDDEVTDSTPLVAEVVEEDYLDETIVEADDAPAVGTEIDVEVDVVLDETPSAESASDDDVVLDEPAVVDDIVEAPEADDAEEVLNDDVDEPVADETVGFDEAVDADGTADDTDEETASQPSEPLLAGGTTVAATSALQRLSAAVAPGDAIPGGDRTIEAFLADLLKPELKSWLDANLSTLVERIVEREIKRLVRDAQPD